MLSRTRYPDLLPPLDNFHDFPFTYFTASGEPHFRDHAGVMARTILQIVPAGDNPYTRRCSAIQGTRDWLAPEVVQQRFEDWRAAGSPIVVHQKQDGVEVAGIGRGRPRFLCGGGMSIYVIREGGEFPTGSEFGGMVAAFAVSLPCSDFSSVAIHILPVEYVMDPELPGTPSGLTPEELNYLLPPAPEFRIGLPSSVCPGFFQALVSFDVSEAEYAEGGGTFMYESFRGVSYLHLCATVHE